MKYSGSGISARTNQIGVVSLAICVALYPALFGQNAYWLSIGNFIAIYSIFAVATCYLFGYGRQILLSCSGFYALGAYGSALLTTKLVHLNPWLAMVLTAFGAGVIAFVLSFVIFRLKHLFFAMVTMVFSFLVFDLLKESDGVTGGLSGIPGIPPLSIAGFRFDSEFKFYCLIWGAALIVLIVFMNIIDSKEGRALRAIGSDDIVEYSKMPGHRVGDRTIMGGRQHDRSSAIALLFQEGDQFLVTGESSRVWGAYFRQPAFRGALAGQEQHRKPKNVSPAYPTGVYRGLDQQVVLRESSVKIDANGQRGAGTQSVPSGYRKLLRLSIMNIISGDKGRGFPAGTHQHGQHQDAACEQIRDQGSCEQIGKHSI